MTENRRSCTVVSSPAIYCLIQIWNLTFLISGFSQLMNRSLTVDSSSVMSTLGYIAPERGHTTRLPEKMDVYSYGVVLLKLITRKKALDSSFAKGMDIVMWVKSCGEREDSVIDEWLGDEAMESAVKEEMVGMIRIALKCTEVKAEERPCMRQAVGMLTDIRSQNRFTIVMLDLV